MYLVTTWFGSFLMEDGDIIQSNLFPKDAGELADRLIKVESDKILQEEKALAKDLKEFFVLERRLERIGGTYVQEELNLPEAEKFSFDKSLLREAMIIVGKKRLRKAVKPDDHISEAIQAIDDLARASNLLSERLHEWYRLHFPELEKLVSGSKYAKLVAEHGDRENIPGFEFEDSVGARLSEGDKKAIMELAQVLTEINYEKERLEDYVESNMKENAPNLTVVAGPLIGARLIHLAGGLEELARMPSSTIQLLGAEKALFRHLKEGTKPPKHGIIFQHPYLHRAPYWQRGKIARAFAGKISIAARVDFYSGKYIGEKLKESLEKSVEDIRRKYEQPPSRGKR